MQKKIGQLRIFFFPILPKKNLGIVKNSWENIFQDAWKIFSSLRIFGQIIQVEFFPLLLKKIQKKFFQDSLEECNGNF